MADEKRIKRFKSSPRATMVEDLEILNKIYKFTSSAINKIVFFFYSTYGIPADVTIEKIKSENNTLYDYMLFVESFNKLHPGVIKKDE